MLNFYGVNLEKAPILSPEKALESNNECIASKNDPLGWGSCTSQNGIILALIYHNTLYSTTVCLIRMIAFVFASLQKPSTVLPSIYSISLVQSCYLVNTNTVYIHKIYSYEIPTHLLNNTSNVSKQILIYASVIKFLMVFQIHQINLRATL